ncbi:MAG: hypothetical protein GY920_00230 [Aliivibrio sp.]|nr:hypothetical protein [Aliivibrio sp.]MCP4321052.1 hypothetical protein [Alteromonadales bacterium]
MIKLEMNEYTDLLSMMYATENLIKYINTDVIKYNNLNHLDLKYLNQRINRVTELITKIDKSEK